MSDRIGGGVVLALTNLASQTDKQLHHTLKRLLQLRSSTTGGGPWGLAEQSEQTC
jgi:hypothetical protein